MVISDDLRIIDDRTFNMVQKQRAEMNVLKYLQTNAKVTISEIQKMFEISRDTANRDLKLLLENELVIRREKGKAINYELA